ncbi:MFS general substrate transporter [Polyplosphaeria fusca]|uniref:MFS general substrate transporter n=1 Tax=Polyplosphaeria fusca TaxID=682080 RepID=A0A9P4QXZ9_9PLEO|nr:MFS general substrate transporter [Polyplosphaeria fusca]
MALEVSKNDIEALPPPDAEKATPNADAPPPPQTAQDGQEATEVAQPTSSQPEIPYSIFTLNEKRFMVFIATFAALFSPVASTIYYPALQPIADRLHVSSSLINLSITTYNILQGLAPAFVGAFSDAEGRRPAYLICFVIFLGANIGLALQTNYAALMVLRAVQSSGSSGTVTLANAVVADFAMSHERGAWMGWVSTGAMMGPAFGPVIGGLLSQYLGWRSIFWFLTIFAGIYLLPILLFFPESCRTVVGNGSLRPTPSTSHPLSLLTTSLLDRRIRTRIAANPHLLSPRTPRPPTRFPNPLTTLALLFEKESSIVLLGSGLLFAGIYAVLAALPSQLESIYHLNALHVGLSFLAFGVGGSLIAPLAGKAMDWNFRRHAVALGLDTQDQRRLRSLAQFPIERARLEVAVPMLLAGVACVLGFGWTLEARTSLAGPLVFLFFLGFCANGSFTVVSTFLIDLFPEKPATAGAAGNLTRCWLGAGASALVVPVIDAVGVGWMFTIVAAIWVLLVPFFGIVVWKGPGWRREKAEKLKRKEEGRESRG